VADARFIEVEIPGRPDRVTASVGIVNHQVDLALLQLSDAVSSPQPIAFDGLPSHLDTVVTVGYPVGGEQASVVPSE